MVLRGTALIVSMVALATPSFSSGDANLSIASPVLDLSTVLSGSIPFDVDESKVRTLVRNGHVTAAHAEFDKLAWQAFIALNSAATATGEASPASSTVDTKTPRLWEFWRPADSVFLPDGALPRPWSDRTETTSDYHWKAAWRDHTNAASNLQAFSGPLVDQNGNWVRYQTRINREEFEYIRSNGLYSQDGQVAFSHREADNQVELPVNDGARRHGAIEIKLAWKELGPNDDPKRFLTRWITADLSEASKPGETPRSRRFLAGLVGMHIAMRTKSSPEWIWSTFEQIDNVRQNRYPDGRFTHANFFDPHAGVAANQLPAANAVQDPDSGAYGAPTPGQKPDRWVESLTRTPVQVQRLVVSIQPGLNPLDASLSTVTREINGKVQRLLAARGSVLRYYELIDTQWPLHPQAPARAGGAATAPDSIRYKTPGEMIPVFLVNTTMETYFQRGPQEAGNLEQDDRLAPGSASIDATPVDGSESCSGCHYSSGIAIDFKRDPAAGKRIVDRNGVPIAIYGENSHGGNTGGANYSWMLQQEPKARRANPYDPQVVVR